MTKQFIIGLKFMKKRIIDETKNQSKSSQQELQLRTENEFLRIRRAMYGCKD